MTDDIVTMIEHIAPNGAHYLTHAGMDSAQAGISYGFFTRQGGVSSGLYAGLNGGLGSDDNLADVSENRARAAAALGQKPAAIASLYQVHSADCITIDTAPPPSGNDRPRADAMVTNLPDILLLLLTADCLPVLFVDQRNGVIGAAHAGWRGAVGGVLEATVAAMCATGASRENITAILGPAICQPSYQIGADMADVIASHHQGAKTCLMTDDSASDERYLFDLPGFARQILQSEELASVLDLETDTYADSARFYSHRWATHQNLPDSGRLISAICLNRKL